MPTTNVVSRAVCASQSQAFLQSYTFAPVRTPPLPWLSNTSTLQRVSERAASCFVQLGITDCWSPGIHHLQHWQTQQGFQWLAGKGNNVL